MNATALHQRREALKHANQRRTAIARTKAEVGALDKTTGLRVAAELLEQPSDTVATMHVGELLQAVRLLGPRTIPSLLKPEPGIAVRPISEYKRVRELPPRQRALLADRLRFRANTRGAA